MKTVNIVLSVSIILVLLLSIGWYYYNEIVRPEEQDTPIELPISNNYDISPPEIKDFNERLKEGDEK